MKGKKLLLIVILLLIIFAVVFTNRQKTDKVEVIDIYQSEAVDLGQKVQEEQPSSEIEKATEMIIKSLAFKNNSDIPTKFTCDGKNINPSLEILDVPEGAKSLALIVDDPDAPGGDWVHWLLWNIDPTATEIAEDSVPDGAIQGLNDFGDNSYGGPCPPSGTHRYQFKVYALDTMFDIDKSSKKPDLLSVMEGHIIGESLLMGPYSRK